ncbi:hypothetical protein AB1Y20_016372 [Prymnesium parvum]|uniref:Uncharacterized protein n=1 Tax=Prymnesium parvum TaxID=97485 RepID=A0AB34ID43_PRYPA
MPRQRKMTSQPELLSLPSFRLLCVLALCRGSGASLVRIHSASSRWHVSCTDGTTHEGRGRFAGRLAARDDSICTLSFDFRAKDGLDVAPAAVIPSSLVGKQPAVPMEGGEEVAAEPSRPRRRAALNSSAVNQTDSSRGCSDIALPFVENRSPVTLLGGNCSTTIALSSHLFPAFASGIPSVCRASYEVWVQQTGLFQLYYSLPPLAYGVTDPSAPMAELCAATCAAAGVQSSHCAVPSPPLTPPPIPPPAGGTGNGSQPIVATTIEQLHQALSTGYSRGHVDHRVLEGFRTCAHAPLSLSPPPPLVLDVLLKNVVDFDFAGALDKRKAEERFGFASRATYGGAFYIKSGIMELTDGVIVANSKSTWAGGAVLALDSTVTIRNGCVISTSDAAVSGGTVALFGGNFVMTDGSTLSYSTSANDAGAISIGGTNAVCNLTDVVIEASTSSGRGSVFDIVDANYPLLILTFVEIKQLACQDSLFAVSQSTFSHAVILRNVTLTQPECTSTPLKLSPASSLGCGDKFISSEQERGVCASANEGSCHEEALPVAGLTSVTCRCPWPEYPNPAFDERLAPYLESGCITPMQLTGVTVVSEKVSVALQKPENVEGRLNLTLQIEGTDNARPAVWRLQNTSNLLLRSPWLRLPALSGTVYPQSISSGVTYVQVPMIFTASGLLERAALYEERLIVDVRSEVGSVSRTHIVDVSLSVQAKTSFVVWGSVHRESGVKLKCEVQRLLSQAFLVDTLQRQYFTACDVDSLPVDHLLPLQRDPRRFRSVMNTSAGTANELIVSYVGAGVYDISFAIPTWGATRISLLLDDTHMEGLAGIATCPLDRVSLPDGREGLVSLVRKAAMTVLYVQMASTGHQLILLPLNVSPASLAPTAPRMLHFIHSSSSMVSGVFPILPLNCCVARVAALMRFALVEVKLECARQRSQVRFAQSVQVQISTSWMESVWIVQM